MLTMRGPEFLALYTLLAIVVYGLVVYSISRRELDNGGPDPRQLRDPYAIAFLRGGAGELLRVVVLNLTLRQKLLLEGGLLMSAGMPLEADSTAPIEAAVLGACSLFITSQQLARAPQVRACIKDYRQELIRAQLIPGPATYKARLTVCLLAMACLIGLAAAKIHVALATGHRNILFLVLLMLVVSGALLIPVGRQRTALGRRALEQLRALFAGLPRRSSEAVPSEAALLAAVFGVYALNGDNRRAWGRIWAAGGGAIVGSGGDGGSPGSCGSAGGGGDGGGGGGGGSGCGGCGGA